MLKKLVTMFLIAAMVTTSVGLNHVNVTAEEQVETSVEDTTEENAADEQAEEASPETEENSGTDTQKAIEESAEQQETTQQETAQEENPEEGDHANSFRYSDGEVLGSVRSKRSIATQSSITQENITRKGIDVSEHNGDIDWEKVKASDVDFVILRCGYGQDQTSQDDKKWLRNVEACEKLGIPYGVYIYSYATNTTKASSEADHVLRLIKGHKLSYPVYFDMEDTSTEKSDLTAIAKTFCNKIQNAGYPVGVYASLSWWNTKLTDTCFGNWYRWIASWSASKCNYNGDFALWQYSENGAVSGISGNVDINYLIGSPADHGSDVSENFGVGYQAYLQDNGWQNKVENGTSAGTTGQSKRIEAFKINLQNQDVSGSIEYRAHVADIGWQDYVSESAIAGTIGKNKQIEAISVKLTGEMADKYDIYYRVHAADFGWLGWAKNGENAGSEGYDKQVEAFQVQLVEKGNTAPGETENAFKKKITSVTYQAHVADIGWQKYVAEGNVSGTTGLGKQMEAIKIALNSKECTGSVEYRVHVADIGWQKYVSENTIGGTTGKGKQMEAISVRLTGGMANKYDIYYRVHVADFGWLGWAKNGENAGSEGYGKQMEAIQIELIEKGDTFSGSTQNSFYVK